MSVAHKDYLISILNYIAAPMLAAVTHDVKKATTDVDISKIVAELLSVTVKLSIEISKLSNFETPQAQENDDSTRAAMAYTASTIVTDYYKKHTKIPDDNALKNIIAGLGTTLSFSENFKEENATTDKISTLAKLDEISVWAGVTNLINQFSFGQDKTRLAVKVSEKINEQVNLIANDATATPKTVRADILKAIIGIYCNCHATEIQQVSNERYDNDTAVKSLWDGFEKQLEILKIIALGIATPEPTTTAESKPADTATLGKNTEAPQSSKNAPTDAPANPMGFFGAGNSDDDDKTTEQKENTPPPQPEPTIDTSETTTAEAEAGTKTATATDAGDKKEDGEDEDNGGGGNPMSFFS